MAELNVLVPTKGRPHSVDRVVDAWFETGAFGVADLVFVIDKDDPEAPAYLEALQRRAGPKWLVLPEWKPLVPKLNWAAEQLTETGMAMAFMGDDHLPRTPMWAQRVLAAAAMYGPSIVYGRDGFQDQNLPTWWAMTNSIVRALGCMVPGNMQHLYCDNVVMEMGKAANKLRYLPDILIEHMHPVAHKAPMDDGYARVNRPEQYERDRAAFGDWVKSQMSSDVKLLQGI